MSCKICSKCFKSMSLDLFPKGTSPVFSRKRACISCTNKRTSDWQKENRSKCVEKLKKWRAANPDRSRDHWVSGYRFNRIKRIESVIRYQKKNPHVKRKSDAKYKKNNPRAIKEWRAKNMDRVVFYNSQRRALRINGTPISLSGEHKNQIIKIYSKCRKINKTGTVVHHVDHIYPLKHNLFCGLHVPWNLRIITGVENSIKHNSIPKGFY